MDYSHISEELIEGDLDPEIVPEVVEHYRNMRRDLTARSYEEAGVHIGKFVEGVVNILRIEFGVEPEESVSIHAFINKAESNGFPNDLQDELRLTIPRLLQAAYEIRSKRESIHSSLKFSVNHLDTLTAIQNCTWTLAELLRIYGTDDGDPDVIASEIDKLARPGSPLIDTYNGKRILMADLDVPDEILVHLYLHGDEVSADELTEWIVGADKLTITGNLGNLKSRRRVHYESGTAMVTPIGEQQAQSIIDDIPELID